MNSEAEGDPGLLEAAELDTSAAEQTKSLARDALAVLKVQAKTPVVGTNPADEVQSGAP